jgi:hypothetical protein
MSKYNYDVPVKLWIEKLNEGGLASLYQQVDERRADAQEMFLIASLTRVFVGRVLGMQFQLRITPTNRKSSQSSERKATNAEMVVFDSFGAIDDYFVKGFQYQYDVEYIRKSMRDECHLRNDMGWKVKP